MSPATRGEKNLDDCAPNSWARVKLGDIHQLAYGKSLTKAARNPAGTFPVYGSSGVVGGHDAYLVEGPVLVIGRKGAVGAVSYCTEPCWPIDTTYYVRPNEHVEIRFSFYLFTHLRLNRLDRSTAIPGLNRDDVHKLGVSIPPLDEQRRIVEKIEALFDEIDRGVESLRAAKATLDLYRKSLMKSAFEGRLTEDWRASNPAKLESPEALMARIREERESRYQDALGNWEKALAEWRTNGEEGKKPAKPKRPKIYPAEFSNLQVSLPALPQCWTWSHLGWCSVGPEYGTSAKSSPHGNVPVIRMGNLQHGRIDWSNLVYTSNPEEIAQYSLKPGDALFNRTNSPELVGKSALYEGEQSALFAGYLVRVNQIDEIASGAYVVYFLNSPFARNHGTTVKTDGVNQSNINATKLQEYPFPFCSSPEQAEIVRRLDSSIEVAAELKAEIDSALLYADLLRQSILKRAFAGQLVPQDSADEPAKALLETIRAARTQPKHNKRKRLATA